MQNQLTEALESYCFNIFSSLYEEVREISIETIETAVALHESFLKHKLIIAGYLPEDNSQTSLQIINQYLSGIFFFFNKKLYFFYLI